MPTDAIRVVIDLRPLQQPEQAPVTAQYLRNLLRAFAADPEEGESFVALLQAGLPDPTSELPGLPVVGRRLLPPTGTLRAAALTVDPFLLRGAEVGTGWRSGSRRVYHVAGADLPLGSRAPVVATLLDLAPWELSDAFQTTPAARFGYRLRARILQGAAAVLVGTEAVRRDAVRRIHLHASRVHAIPLAGSLPEPAAASIDTPPRYHAFFIRHDARSDVHTLFEALAQLRERPRPEELPADVAWPPVLLMVGGSPNDRAELARLADREGVGEAMRYAPYGSPAELAAIVSKARTAVIPTLSDAAALPAIDALALGTPVIGSKVGALPEVIGRAGVIVEPHNTGKLARAIAATWTEDELHAGVVSAAASSPYAARTWREVAAATRAIYREVAR